MAGSQSDANRAAAARNARLNARVQPGRPQGIKTTTGQPRVPVSNKEAREASRTMAQRPNNTTRARAVSKPDNTVGIGRSEMRQITKKQPVVTATTKPKSPAEIANAKRVERNTRLTNVLKPLIPRGTPAGGERRSLAEEAKYKSDLFPTGKYKVVNPNTSRPRILSDAESKALAQRKATDAAAAKDAAMRDAARIRDAKVAQDRPGPHPLAEGVNRAESDARVAKGLQHIKAAEAAQTQVSSAKPIRSVPRRAGGIGMGGGMNVNESFAGGSGGRKFNE